MLKAFWQVVGLPPKSAQFSAAHRWRFALPPDPLAESCLFESEMKVGACGDWCAGPRVEGAFLSGMSAASRVLGLLKPSELPKVVKGKFGTPFDPEQPE
jgi:predicted NAD/FAD-dependent oxidoreductase